MSFQKNCILFPAGMFKVFSTARGVLRSWGNESVAVCCFHHYIVVGSVKFHTRSLVGANTSQSLMDMGRVRLFRLLHSKCDKPSWKQWLIQRSRHPLSGSTTVTGSRDFDVSDASGQRCFAMNVCVMAVVYADCTARGAPHTRHRQTVIHSNHGNATDASFSSTQTVTLDPSLRYSMILWVLPWCLNAYNWMVVR
jgi:hypothetical protein